MIEPTRPSPSEADLADAAATQRFRRALAHVLALEGGFVDDPADPGGATRYGISLSFARGLDPGVRDAVGLDHDKDGAIAADDIRHLTVEQAIQLYRGQFWDRFGYARLPAPVGEKLFDLAVNMGPGQAHKLLQRAIPLSGGPAVAVDGALGPRTLAAASALPPMRLLASLKAEALAFYRRLVLQRPALARFKRGWERRAQADPY